MGTFTFGLNYYLYGHKLKFMAGVGDDGNANSDNGRQRRVSGREFITGVR